MHDAIVQFLCVTLTAHAHGHKDHMMDGREEYEKLYFSIANGLFIQVPQILIIPGELMSVVSCHLDYQLCILWADNFPGQLITVSNIYTCGFLSAIFFSCSA